jgi:hypothetical protein
LPVNVIAEITQNYPIYGKFEVLTAVILKVEVFWDVPVDN